MIDPFVDVDEALAVAVAAHGDQRYGVEPYVVHLRQVMDACRRLGFASAAHLVVAALHDTIEDTSLTSEAISARFGASAAEAVRLLSRRPGQDERVYLEQMNALAFAVKLADRNANVSQLGLCAPSEIVRHRDKLLPKYLREQALMEARARQLGPEFVAAAAENAVALGVAARRLTESAPRAT